MKRNILANILGSITVVAGTTVALEPSYAMFQPPVENAAPSQATGGASRSVFSPSGDNGAPNQATGGASRSVFIPNQGNTSPGQATGGASRTPFSPSSDNGAPSRATGGASRDVFIPSPTNTAPAQASGGAARGSAFSPASNNPAPVQADSGAARTSIYGNYLTPDAAPVSMLPLTPGSYYGTTLSERPGFLVYLPVSNAQEAVFSLKDEADNMVYQMVIPTSGQAEVVVIQLPQEAPALEVNRNYQWYVALKINGELNPSAPFVDAWVKRIEPTRAQVDTLAGGESLQAVSQLAQDGVWYDSVSILANLRLEEPGSDILARDWDELLSSVGLADVSEVRLISVNR